MRASAVAVLVVVSIATVGGQNSKAAEPLRPGATEQHTEGPGSPTIINNQAQISFTCPGIGDAANR
jgi:hypothetical protein